jgi:hypothetical protein
MGDAAGSHGAGSRARVGQARPGGGVLKEDDDRI